MAKKGVPIMEANTLRAIPIFEGLSEDDLDRCAKRFQETEILQGSGLTREDDFAYKFFVVIEGEVEVLRDFDSVAMLGPGDFFGEMGLISGERRNARVVAHTRCQLAWMMGWDFSEMTEELPAVAARIEETVAERMASIPTDDS